VISERRLLELPRRAAIAQGQPLSLRKRKRAGRSQILGGFLGISIENGNVSPPQCRCILDPADLVGFFDAKPASAEAATTASGRPRAIHLTYRPLQSDLRRNGGAGPRRAENDERRGNA
jgi:hypothetical protein